MEATFYYLDGSTLNYHDGSQNVIRIVWENGAEEYYQNGLLHREEGLPALIHEDGSKEYWINGQRRLRADGPSIEWANGDIEYSDNRPELIN